MYQNKILFYVCLLLMISTSVFATMPLQPGSYVKTVPNQVRISPKAINVGNPIVIATVLNQSTDIVLASDLTDNGDHDWVHGYFFNYQGNISKDNMTYEWASYGLNYPAIDDVGLKCANSSDCSLGSDSAWYETTFAFVVNYKTGLHHCVASCSMVGGGKWELCFSNGDLTLLAVNGTSYSYFTLGSSNFTEGYHYLQLAAVPSTTAPYVTWACSIDGGSAIALSHSGNDMYPGSCTGYLEIGYTSNSSYENETDMTMPCFAAAFNGYAGLNASDTYNILKDDEHYHLPRTAPLGDTNLKSPALVVDGDVVVNGDFMEYSGSNLYSILNEYMDFNGLWLWEGTSDVVIDSSGEHWDALCTGSINLVNKVKLGQGYYMHFNGIDDALILSTGIPEITATNYFGNLTLTILFRTQQSGDIPFISFRYYYSVSEIYRVYQYTTTSQTRAYIVCDDNGGVESYYLDDNISYSPPILSDGKWHIITYIGLYPCTIVMDGVVYKGKVNHLVEDRFDYDILYTGYIGKVLNVTNATDSYFEGDMAFIGFTKRLYSTEKIIEFHKLLKILYNL